MHSIAEQQHYESATPLKIWHEKKNPDIGKTIEKTGDLAPKINIKRGMLSEQLKIIDLENNWSWKQFRIILENQSENWV